MKRDAFGVNHPHCWICGGMASDTHEIARGVNRAKALKYVSCWLRLCHHCHMTNIHGTGFWARLDVQYALKLIQDGQHYNRVQLNEIRGRAPDAISELEVAAVLPAVIRELQKYGSLLK